MRTSWIEICFDMMADYIEDFQSLADKHKFIEISTHCLSLSEHVENSFSKSCEWVSFYTFLAEGFRSVGMYEKSLEIVEKSINLINEFSEEVEISVRVWAYFIYAVITSNTEDYDTVRLYAEKVVSLYKLHDFKENKDYDLLCNTYRLLSYAARSECEFEESLLFLQSASDLSEKVSSDFRINIVHIDVERALIYLDDESHDKATQIVENACEHLELIEMYRVNMSSFPLLLSDIGYIYGQINKWNKALEFHLRC
ncbi:MAG: hypothetical protein LBC86_03665, partial [Oscillospiraceae bacterium]|nr:hypothetical protein [Oscillospiraceae bacterium]